MTIGNEKKEYTLVHYLRHPLSEERIILNNYYKENGRPDKIKRGEAFGVIVVKNINDKEYACGISICNKSDTFSKKRALKIATDRINKRKNNNPVAVNFRKNRFSLVESQVEYMKERSKKFFVGKTPVSPDIFDIVK